MKKYIQYIKKYIHPSLSPEAAQELKKFYLSLRQNYDENNMIPITIRQFESLIRLSQARAKLECRLRVERSDALEVI